MPDLKYSMLVYKQLLSVYYFRKDNFDCSSSDDEEIGFTPYSSNVRCNRAKRKAIEQAVICLSETIYLGMERLDGVTELPLPVSSEESCIELWRQGSKCYCSWTPIKLTRRRFDYDANVSKRLDFKTEETGILLFACKLVKNILYKVPIIHFVCISQTL